MDAADATTWLQELQSGLESASCGRDQAGAEALLLNHLRLERTLSVFSAELHRLDEQARVAAARASLTVCGRGGAGRARAPEPQACDRGAASVSHGHTNGWKREDICGP